MTASVQLTCGDGTSVIVKEDDAARASKMIAAHLAFPGSDDKKILTLPEIRSGTVLKLVASWCTGGMGESRCQDVRDELEKSNWNILDETAQAADYLVMSSLLEAVADIFVSKARGMTPPALKASLDQWTGTGTGTGPGAGTDGMDMFDFVPRLLYEAKDPNLVDYYYCANCFEREPDVTQLKQCARCKIVKYCSQKCQKEHFEQHKHDCKHVDKMRKKTEKLKRELENHRDWLTDEPSNLFETSVGHFYSIFESRDFCRAHFGLGDAMKKVAW